VSRLLTQDQGEQNKVLERIEELEKKIVVKDENYKKYLVMYKTRHIEEKLLLISKSFSFNSYFWQFSLIFDLLKFFFIKGS